jgi:2-polyprenyl-6-hydroxyphenyl methylase/3-demethylubiquinone-9 3-methyltransferase
MTMRGKEFPVLAVGAPSCLEAAMAETSTSEGLTRATTSIVATEIEQFASHARDWWDPSGSEAMLHKLNPVRLAYLRDQVDQHWSLDEHSFKPLAGKSALDVGCGAGLLAEPLARLGAAVTAVDASSELIDVACAHAAGQGLAIDYRAAPVEQVDGHFDLVTSMEVIEHVADPAAFVRALAARLAPGGLLIMSTPNATAWSRLLTITIGEGIGAVPKGTHDFGKFISPERMQVLLADAGLKCLDIEGIAWSPTRGFHLSEDARLNYLIAAIPN